MRGIVSREPGGPETLAFATLPDPVAGGDQLLIAVRACGLNFPDVLMIRDLYQVKASRPFVPGAEVAGIVIGIGDDVRGFAIGDRVMARCGMGGLAETIAVDAGKCSPIPDAMPMEHAAAFQFAYETAIHALKDRARLTAGETVLIMGGAGGVAIAATQVAKAFGARVVSIASSREKLDFAIAQGADDGVVYGALDRPEDRRALLREIRQRVGPNGADVILDPVGGDLAEIAFRAGGEGVRYLVLGFTAGISALPLNLPLLKSAEVHGVNWRTFVLGQASASTANRDALLRLYEEGRIAPPIAASFPLEDSAQALAVFDERRVLGKIVVTI